MWHLFLPSFLLLLQIFFFSMFSLLCSSNKRCVLPFFSLYCFELFSVTIQNVQEQSHDLWRYQRFLIVKEFSEKPLLPPPFSIISYIFMSIQRFRSQRRSSTYQVHNSLMFRMDYLFSSQLPVKCS